MVLLQTTCALASDSTLVHVRILFKDHTLLNNLKHLNLKHALRKERLQLNSFEESGFKGKGCTLVQICLQKLNSGDN